MYASAAGRQLRANSSHEKALCPGARPRSPCAMDRAEKVSSAVCDCAAVIVKIILHKVRESHEPQTWDSGMRQALDGRFNCRARPPVVASRTESGEDIQLHSMPSQKSKPPSWKTRDTSLQDYKSLLKRRAPSPHSPNGIQGPPKEVEGLRVAGWSPTLFLKPSTASLVSCFR